MMDATGYCERCKCTHRLPQAPARAACLELMDKLEKHRDLLFENAGAEHASLGTDYLFGPARGKMFGALVGEDEQGKSSTLYAFSGQYNGHWTVPGWVDPVFSPEEFVQITFHEEREIKALGRQIDELAVEDERRILKQERKQRSKQLMQRIFDMYRFHNFRAESAGIFDVYRKEGLPPTGTGECCAPKLLHHAAKKGIKPVGIAEFYWGKENASKTRKHGEFYPPCASKCEPILGFLLCGIESYE